MSGPDGTMRVDRTAFSVAAAFDAPDEREYWLSRSPAERLEHLEMLRRINYGELATGRMERVLEVVRADWR